MKKIVSIALLAMLALSVPVFAEVTVSGEFDYSAMINGDEVAGKFDKVELDVNADIDENNVFSMEIEDKLKLNDLDGSTPEINYAKVETDWSGLFGIDQVGISTTLGFTDFGGGDDHYITSYEFENFGGVYTDKEGGMKVAVSIAGGIVTPYAAYMFDNHDKATYASDGSTVLDENDEVEMLLGAVIDFAPVWADVYYLTAKEGAVDGIFGAEVYGGIDLGSGMKLELVATYGQNLADDLADGEESVYGAGAAFKMAPFKVGLSLNGNDDQAAESLGVDAAYDVNDMLVLKAGTAFYLGDEDGIDSFLEATIMAEIKASENVSYTAGYIIADGQGGTVRFKPGPEAVAADGGFFVGCAVNF